MKILSITSGKDVANKRKESERILKEYRMFLKKKKLNEGEISNENVLEENEFFKKVEKALLVLNEEERLLLHYRYIENGGDTFDYIVKDQLGVSERTYYRIKANALLTFYELVN